MNRTSEFLTLLNNNCEHRQYDGFEKWTADDIYDIDDPKNYCWYWYKEYKLCCNCEENLKYIKMQNPKYFCNQFDKFNELIKGLQGRIEYLEQQNAKHDKIIMEQANRLSYYEHTVSSNNIHITK